MIAIITGASRGIGYETVKYLMHKPGMKVYALSRDVKGLRELSNYNTHQNGDDGLHPVTFDLDMFLDRPGMIWENLHEDIEHIDILINNAGQMLNQPFGQISLDELERIYRINVFAPAMLIKELLPVLGRKGISHVVNIGSMGGYQGSLKFSGLAGYSSSKAALACLTECLSQEYKDTKIVFNCLALGSVQTEMFAEAFPGYEASMGPREMAEYIAQFALNGHRYYRGKVLPVSSSTP